MTRPWDTWMITLAGAVAGLLAGLGFIVAGRFDMLDAGPVSLGPLILFIAGAAGMAFAGSWLRNRVFPRGGS